MESNLAPAASRDNCATEQAKKPMGIIFGVQRTNGCWCTVVAMTHNGHAIVRDGCDVRLIPSEAFETEKVS